MEEAVPQQPVLQQPARQKAAQESVQPPALPKAPRQAGRNPVFDLKAKAQKAIVDLRATSFENRGRIDSLKKLFSTANAEKLALEQANKGATALREQKTLFSKQVISLKKELKSLNDEVKKATGGRLVGSSDALMQKLEHLEWEQQTSTSAGKEKDLAKQIKALEKELPAAKKFKELREQMRKKREALAPLEKQLDGVCEKLRGLAADGKKHHENLVKISAKIRESQKLIGEKLDEVSEKKELLDSTQEQLHFALDSAQQKQRAQKKEFERKKNDADGKERAEKQNIIQARKSVIAVKAEEVKKKLLLGKKINMEEFQLLQETGI